MTARVCVVCGEPIPSWSRADRRTCGAGCRSRLSRSGRCNTSATPLAAAAPRSGGQASREPDPGQTGTVGAVREADAAQAVPTVSRTSTGPSPRPADSLIRALARYVEALQQRYPDGPDQMRKENLDARGNMPRMCKSGRATAA